ncbi:MAG TPA: hypothetical protein VMS99_14545 [Acidimicrobiia bacterium]|nr:hypothetical protein [Acidimicrobiia bacterium]
MLITAVVVEDCVDSMDGAEYHDAALRCIQRAFGWVYTSDDVIAVGVGMTGLAAGA